MFPLVLLALCAAGAGFIPFGEYVSSDGYPLQSEFHLAFSIAPVALGLAGILLALWFYMRASDRADRMAATLKGLYTAAYNKFYIDELYLFITKKVLFNLVGRPAAWIDKHIVDGAVNLTGNETLKFSELIKKLQSGKVQQYALFFLGGVVVLAVLFIYIWH